MFCPTCGEMGFIRDGIEGKTYQRVLSTRNQGHDWWMEDKPGTKTCETKYNADGSRVGSDVEPDDEPLKTNLLRPPKKKTHLEMDLEDWKRLGQDIKEFNTPEKVEESEVKGKKYAQCKNPYCEYHGPAKKVKIGTQEIDFEDINSVEKTKTRTYEVIKDSDKLQGVLTKGTYMCPNRIDGTPCDCIEVFSYLEQTRSSDEPETRMLTCKDCGHGWREY